MPGGSDGERAMEKETSLAQEAVRRAPAVMRRFTHKRNFKTDRANRLPVFLLSAAG